MESRAIAIRTDDDDDDANALLVWFHTDARESNLFLNRISP